jgi:hypothetical protein
MPLIQFTVDILLVSPSKCSRFRQLLFNILGRTPENSLIPSRTVTNAASHGLVREKFLEAEVQSADNEVDSARLLNGKTLYQLESFVLLQVHSRNSALLSSGAILAQHLYLLIGNSFI